MTKIVLNPIDGATIKNIMFRDEKLFDSKKDEQFEPGMLVECEDDVADFLVGDSYINKLGEKVVVKQGLYEFLQIVEPEEAKKYLAETKDQLKCVEEGCTFSTRLKSKMIEHDKTHRKEKLVGSLGIPLVGRAKSQAINTDDNEGKVRARERAWDSQDQDMGDGFPGLSEGEGLRKDTTRPDAIMS